jgi:hypothetical protein
MAFPHANTKNPGVLRRVFRCSLFPTAAIVDAFKKTQKLLHINRNYPFSINKPVPRALIKKLVKARAAQLEKKDR